MPLTGREKATIFLSILGGETSARVLRYLPDELADLIASGINHLPSPSPDALSEVLRDFQSYMALPESRTAAAPQIAERPQPATPPKPKRQYNVLVYERPQLTAFLLTQLPEGEREEALLTMPRERQQVNQLMNNLKRNQLREKIAQRLREQFKDKLFAEAAG